MTKFVFFSSSKFGLPLLKKLQKEFALAAIISRADKPKGRKQVPTPTPISEYALKQSIPLYRPKKITPQLIYQLPQTEFAFLFAYGKIIPYYLLNFFPKGIINLHPSLLPKYRGPSPVRSALIDCQKETGYSFMLLEKELDSGPILFQEKVPISATDNWQSLTEKIVGRALPQLNSIIRKYLQGKIHPKPQDHSQASYTKKITHQTAFLAAETEPTKAVCLIQAMSPYPGAYISVQINNQKRELKIHQATAVNNLLKPQIVQLESKKPVSWKQFLDGYPQAKFSYPRLAYLN